MDRSAQMGRGSIPRLLIRFSIPAIVGMLLNALYNVVDRIFIGRGVGALGLAGATVGFPIMLVLMAFGMLIGLGGNSLVSIRLGEKRREEAERVLGNSFTLLIVQALVLTVLGLVFLEPLLNLFGASPAILPYAEDYLSIILLGAVFQAVGFGLNNFIRGEGNPRMAMLTMLIGAVLNTILDPILIFGFGLGIRGAALATIVSQAVAAAWVLAYFLGGKSLLKIRLPALRPHLPTVVRILVIGSSPFVMQLAASVLNAILNSQLQRYGGDLAISAMGIIFSLLMVILMPIFGLNQGAQPLLGYNYGARQYDRVRQTLKLAIGAASALTVLGFLATQLFTAELIRLFSGQNPELLAIGTHAMRTFLIMLPIIGFQIVASNYFQATGKPHKAMLLSTSRQVLLFIPSLLILPRFLGLDGIWLSGPLSDLVSSILTALFLFRELAHLGREHREVQAEGVAGGPATRAPGLRYPSGLGGASRRAPSRFGGSLKA